MDISVVLMWVLSIIGLPPELVGNRPATALIVSHRSASQSITTIQPAVLLDAEVPVNVTAKCVQRSNLGFRPDKKTAAFGSHCAKRGQPRVPDPVSCPRALTMWGVGPLVVQETGEEQVETAPSRPICSSPAAIHYLLRYRSMRYFYLSPSA